MRAGIGRTAGRAVVSGGGGKEAQGSNSRPAALHRGLYPNAQQHTHRGRLRNGARGGPGGEKPAALTGRERRCLAALAMSAGLWIHFRNRGESMRLVMLMSGALMLATAGATRAQESFMELPCEDTANLLKAGDRVASGDTYAEAIYPSGMMLAAQTFIMGIWVGTLAPSTVVAAEEFIATCDEIGEAPTHLAAMVTARRLQDRFGSLKSGDFGSASKH